MNSSDINISWLAYVHIALIKYIRYRISTLCHNIYAISDKELYKFLRDFIYWLIFYRLLVESTENRKFARVKKKY